MRTLLLFLALASVALPSHAIPRIIRDTTAEPVKRLPEFLVPNGAVNIARGKPVTSSDEKPIIGALAQITDGEKNCWEGNWVELDPGSQWIQIDLGAPSRIFGIQIWRYFGETRVYRDVVVRLADDPDFITNARTVYNNDRDNSSGLGIGTDKEVYEYHQGHLIDTRGKNYEGTIARYVRFYSNGNTSDPRNQYIEVEVIGKQSDPPRPNDLASLRKRGEFKNWKFTVTSTFYSRWQSAEANKSLPPETVLPKEFVVPQEVVDLVSPNPWSPVYFSISWSFSTQPPGKQNYYLYPTPPWHRLSSGLQWMQADLQAVHFVHAIRLWHWQYDEAGRVCHDVIVQTADDAKFTRNVRTLFNNDTDNSAKRGKGTNKEYCEGPNGLLIDTRGKELRGIEVRYLRFYSRGEGPNDATHYVKAEIIGQSPPEPIQHPPSRPDLMVWKTSYPMPSYL